MLLFMETNSLEVIMPYNNTIFRLAFMIIPFLFAIFVNVIIGFIASGMAKSRGLNPVAAFFAAFFCSFIALFYIAMHPKKNEIQKPV